MWSFTWSGFGIELCYRLPTKVKSLILIAPQYNMPKFLLKVQNVLFKFMPESQFKDIGLTKRTLLPLQIRWLI